MSPGTFAIGVDYGTASGRVLLLDLGTGEEVAVHELAYPHGAIEERLPDGPDLGADWSLQHPDDWLAVLEVGIPEVLAGAGVPARAVVGIGVDVTSCTVLPTSADGTPLCTMERWRARPHAWPKLWKHHSAQHVADRLNEVAAERAEPFLARYGGRVSSEWYFPKLIELWLEDRELYGATDRFLEATDWIVWHLTGQECRSSCPAGYKALWSPRHGLPPTAYFEAAFPGFDRPAEKLGERFFPLGTRAGSLRPELAGRLGLGSDVAVAVGNVDSFVSAPGAGAVEPGTYLMVVGTSICDVVVDREEILMPGITGVVEDGVVPGLFGYEAGQAAVGDMLGWFVRRLGRAASSGTDVFGALEASAGSLRPGETGLVALDWWNGNRSILGDADLAGVLAGMTLQTTEAELYRALLESIAFGNRRIIDNLGEHGLTLGEIVACGGVAQRSGLLMQLVADVSGRRVHVPASSQIPARGAALFGAVAAGSFPDIVSAAQALRPPLERTYAPDAARGQTYDAVYRIYRELYDTLGGARAGWLHGLRRIRREVRAQAQAGTGAQAGT